MCFKNKKLILLKECFLKYWDITGNILLYRNISHSNYPFWIYFIAIISTLFSFGRLMLKFRRIEIKSINWLMYPMLPCEQYMCDTRENGTYEPAFYRIIFCGYIVLIFWLWYAILIYPFITFFVIISVFYYNINDNEFNQLLLLYKNHNIIALFIEDIPIIIVLIGIYMIDKKGLFTLIWVSILTVWKSLTLFRRYYRKYKILYDLNDIKTEINEYEVVDSNSLSDENIKNENITFASIDDDVVDVENPFSNL